MCYALDLDLDGGGPAVLASASNPPRVPVTDEVPPNLGGRLTGGDHSARTGTEYIASHPPDPIRQPFPHRPATHPGAGSIHLLREVELWPLMRGARIEIELHPALTDGYQAPNEIRGNTYRQPPGAWDEQQVYGGWYAQP